MMLKSVERIATEIDGPWGNEGGVERLVITWGRRVSADALVRIR